MPQKARELRMADRLLLAALVFLVSGVAFELLARQLDPGAFWSDAFWPMNGDPRELYPMVAELVFMGTSIGATALAIVYSALYWFRRRQRRHHLKLVQS
ncbi:MAG: hypothetical protein UY92_C0004G0072 [Candidatus Magasanikbacteria bacterium GW2011_GWA2_56_11]|uniref:Uncharacterized protein n=1 Tax=Candidatus Magasanikbacteria bacterium GW2011_GWA2_56_11 TaxID=1619044 RepID=A0A0G1YHM7_9BACT|nr:MAG: hypothetical protein UY92_C0004G0072 [Candidatus Magasanikbacteria bacterium GW2011_GWA2_56_11]